MISILKYKKIILGLLSLISIYPLESYSQYVPNQWVWIKGDSVQTSGTYGTLGVADPANIPPSRSAACTWTDVSGNLWLFGGFGGTTNKVSSLNDLWKYSPTTNQWTWVGGDSTIRSKSSRFGTKGVANASNQPGSQSNIACWTDAFGNFWMLGGSNAMWKYEPVSGFWTWMAGDTLSQSNPVYGIQGQADPNYSPGTRQNAVTFVDQTGNLWLYGGLGIDRDGMSGLMGDLWKFSPVTQQWAWMKGSSSRNTSGNYGTKGVPSSSNSPGGRDYSSGWADTSGNLWLFGGNYFETFSNGAMNDLWKYSIATNQWTWMGGANTKINNQTALRAVYGKRGISDTANRPRATIGGKSFRAGSGDLWLVGGSGLNVFWRYTPATNQWAWMYGDTTTNIENYGSKGVASSFNNPGPIESRNYWNDVSGNLWLFGHSEIVNGASFYISDLWAFPLDANTLPVLFSNFTARKQQASVQLEWTTAQEQNTRYFVVQRANGNGNYDSIGTVLARGTSISSTGYSFVDIGPFQDLNLYRLKQVDIDGKFMYSGVLKVAISSKTDRFTILQNPVQATLQLNTQLLSNQKMTIQIRDMNGHLLIREDRMVSQGSSIQSIPVGHLSRGTYIVQITSTSINSIKTFIKQ